MLLTRQQLLQNSSCQLIQQQSHHADLNHRRPIGCQPFVITTMATIVEQLRECPQRDHTLTIICARIHHYDCDDQPQRVHQEVPLATFDLLLAIEADRLALGGAFDTLRVDTASRGLRLSLLAASLQLTPRLHQGRPGPVVSPTLEVAVDRTQLPKSGGSMRPWQPVLLRDKMPSTTCRVSTDGGRPRPPGCQARGGRID